jgi:tetratricopeptide (TPR) repeat protein
MVEAGRNAAEPGPGSGELERAREAWLEAVFRAGSFDQAEIAARAAEHNAQLTGDHAELARARVLLGLIRHYRSTLRPGEAGREEREDAAAAEEETMFRSALILAEAVADRAGVAAALLGIGLVEQALRHDWNEAMPYFRRAQALIPEIRRRRAVRPHARDLRSGTEGAGGSERTNVGEVYVEAEIHTRLGLYFLQADSKPERAAHHFGLAHALHLETRDERLIPGGLTALAAADRARGRYARAAAYAAEAARRAREAGLSAAWIAGAEAELRAAEAGLTAAGAEPGAEPPPCSAPFG